MGLLDRWLYGVDLDEEQQRGDTYDAALADLNRQRLQSGAWTEEQFQTAERNRIAGATGNVGEQVSDSFWQGWTEGRDRITGTINSGIGGVLKGIWHSVPLAVWVLILIAAFLYLGGADYLRRKLASA